MNLKLKPGGFVAIALTLMVPYLAFAVYFSRRFLPDHWPLWFTEILAVWFIANFLVLFLLAKRMSARKVSDSLASEQVTTRAHVAVWIFRIFASYLVILWIAFFLHGAIGTLAGRYPLARAIPAGAFLLFFILLFGWGIYRSFRRKA